jgi:hypothetical protein
MNSWQNRSSAFSQRPRTTQHEFAIGPLCKHGGSAREARVYYCIRCKWSFLVCGRKVAVLAEDSSPISGDESLHRFATFEEGPCPAFETFAPVSSFNAGPSQPHFRKKGENADHLAAPRPQLRLGRPRRVVDIVNRVREDLPSVLSNHVIAVTNPPTFAWSPRPFSANGCVEPPSPQGVIGSVRRRLSVILHQSLRHIAITLHGRQK